MNIRGIKNHADQIYLQYRKQIIPEFFYVGYVGLLAQYLQSGLFSFFVSLFLCPISHGYVKCAMKLTDHEHAKIDYHESMIGVIEFARVAPAYLMKKAFILVITLFIALPSLMKFQAFLPELSLEWFSSLGNAFIQTEFFVPHFYHFQSLIKIPLLFANLICCVFAYLFLTTLLIPVPYVMEEKDYSWNECIIYSLELMKGNIIWFFKLYILYLPRHFIYWSVTGIALIIIGTLGEIMMLFCLVTSLFFYISIFKGRFEIAKYLFYKEIRGDNCEGNSEDQEDNN